jgi:enterochelin esterase-like enzyme
VPLTVTLPDEDARYRAVWLETDLPLPDEQRAFAREDGAWVLRLPDELHVTRLEYMLGVQDDESGDWDTIANPEADAVVTGVFGDKSVALAEDYADPWWLGRDGIEGELHDEPLHSRALKADVSVLVWTPAGVAPDEPLPLLVANDGPEYDALGCLTRYAAVLIGDDELPAFRIALLAPGPRDTWYSCSPQYARALCTEVIPHVANSYALRGRAVGMGASLGALSMLHAQRRHPGTFSGLFLQSGSFFVPRFDAHEREFPHYQRVVRFSRAVLRATSHGETLPVTLTCGAEEENIRNNRLICTALRGQGYETELAELGDTHNYTAWRDAFDPHLTDLLLEAWEG